MFAHGSHRVDGQRRPMSYHNIGNLAVSFVRVDSLALKQSRLQKVLVWSSGFDIASFAALSSLAGVFKPLIVSIIVFRLSSLSISFLTLAASSRGVLISIIGRSSTFRGYLTSAFVVVTQVLPMNFGPKYAALPPFL